jgi:serine/threonine protein kinase/Tol biopolymer transport system component
MTPERWEQIGQFYHAALELAPAERADFLARVCDGDEALRLEVESLISAAEQAGDFIAASALKDASELLTVETTEQHSMALGKRQIGHYQIESLLGAGGMGEVYLAQDTRLGRQVAIKLLPPEAAHDPTAKRRLLREARAAAALNHPNIVTIHSIEEADNSVFIVMEYVEGDTLTTRISGGMLEFILLLDVGAQVADALAAAHSVGLIHRDIKPSNILITQDGQVKLLDFGIAKVTKPFHTEGGANSRLTAEGDIVGTVAYMSPEQGRGEALDSRTDIFSLGAVLYESATGKTPFSGPNALAILRQIDATEPPAPSAIKPGLQPGFDQIIERALSKDRARRYQSASEFAAALRRLKGKAVGVSSFDEEEMPELDEAQEKSEYQAGVEAIVADSASSDQRLDPGVMRGGSAPTPGRKKAAAYTAGIIVAVAALAFAAYKLFDRIRSGPAESPAPLETRLTNTGNIGRDRAAISPDGKYVAYAVHDSQQTSSLWVRQLAAFSSAQIIPPARVIYGGVTFSRDGNHIFYVMREEKSPVAALYRIALLGGASQKIIDDVAGNSPVSFAPDGSRFVFRRELRWRGGALFVANEDGSGEQRIAMAAPPEFFGDPAWSPNGKVIACSAGHADGGSNRYVVAVSVGDWVMRPVSAKKWRWVGPVEWLSDGKGLLMIASDSPAEPYRVWRLSYPSGQAERVTNNADTYTRLSLTADSSLLLALQQKRSTNLWMIPAEEPRLARKMTYGTGGFRSHLRWTTGGKIVFDSETAGVPDISVMDEDGGAPKQLLGDLIGQATAGSVTVSPDGRHVFFCFDPTGMRDIWRMDINGGNLIQLTQGGGKDNPHCSPDGKWLIYTDIGSDKPTLWKVSTDSGEPVQLTKTFSRLPSVSPDGKLIACFYSNEESGVRWKLALLPIDGGEPVKVFPQALYTGFPAKWTPDGRALTYTDASQSNIWLQPVEDGEPRKLTDFTNDLIFGYEWSPDGKRLACVRGIWERDLVLIKNFR